MIIIVVIWIISSGLISFKLDLVLLNSIDKMSDTYHFVIITLTIIFFFHFIFYYNFLKKYPEFIESSIWIVFITVTGISCRNKLNYDINTANFLVISFCQIYNIYIVRLLNPREEKFLSQKIIIIIVITFLILWPTISYVWPYGTDYPDDFDWDGWPDNLDP